MKWKPDLKLPTPFLLVGNFHSCNTLWGNQTQVVVEEKKINKIIDNSDLFLLNKGSPIHFSIAH